MPKNPCRNLIERLPWQFYYWSGVTILFAYAAWQRFAVPLDPVADPDTWGYLSPALRELTGGAFGHTSGRNFLYPGFLYLLLRAFGDFRAITVAQHFLGLLAGGVLLLTWRRTRCFVANPRVSLGSHHVLGLLAAAIFLLASEPIRHFDPVGFNQTKFCFRCHHCASGHRNIVLPTSLGLAKNCACWRGGSECGRIVVTRAFSQPQ